MGVERDVHRRGVGTALVEAAERYLSRLGTEYLQVKTVGPSRPSPAYEGTRRFYESLDFAPLEEIHELWPGNPCLILVKRVLDTTCNRPRLGA